MLASTRILAPVLLLSFLMTACHTAQKYMESGDYDGAIEFCVHKLRGKSKKKTEYVRGLEAAFQRAHARDQATVRNLVAAGRPENWERIHAIHQAMADRQRRIAPLLPLVSSDGYRATFDLLDVAALERESRTNAADYLYNHAKTLLEKAENGDKLAARSAYRELRDLESKYYRDYKDTDKLMQAARELGTSYILFEVNNRSAQVLPRNFVDQILAIGKKDLDSEWKAYYFDKKPGETFDYRVVFNVSDVDISPERVHERAYVDEKEIRDGWDYVLDAKGNVLKDSLGNDVKKPRMVCIRANVIEVYQTKAARLTGRVEVYDAQQNTLLDSRQLGTEILFENYASTYTGDKRALSDDTKRRIGNAPQPFPRNEDMLVQAAERLKPDLKKELRSNRVIL